MALDLQPIDDIQPLDLQPLDEPAAPPDIGPIEGLGRALQRGVKSISTIVPTALMAGTATAGPSIRQERRAYEQAMADPAYMGNLGIASAGEDVPRMRKVEAQQGPQAKLAQITAPHDTIKEIWSGVVADLAKERAAIPQSKAQQTLAQARTTSDKWAVWRKYPVQVTASIVAESLPPSIAGAVLGSVAGPAGVAAGVGLSSFSMEASNALLDEASQQGYDITDQASLQKFLNDGKGFNKALDTAITRAAIIGSIDTGTAGQAGKFIEPALKLGIRKVIAASGKEVGLQAVGGAGGELAGQAATKGGKPYDWFDVAMEGLAEIAGAPAEAVGNIRQSRRVSRFEEPKRVGVSRFEEPTQVPPVRNFEAPAKPKEPDASPVRTDQGELPAQGQAPQESQGVSSPNVQQVESVQPKPVAQGEAKAPNEPVLTVAAFAREYTPAVRVGATGPIVTGEDHESASKDARSKGITGQLTRGYTLPTGEFIGMLDVARIEMAKQGPERPVAQGYRDPQTGEVIPGHPLTAHKATTLEATAQELRVDPEKLAGMEPGFITNRGRYVTRAEADALAPPSEAQGLPVEAPKRPLQASEGSGATQIPPKPSTGQGEAQRTLKVGDEAVILSIPVVLADSKTDANGMRYEIFSASQGRDKRAVIRVTDTDSGNVTSLWAVPTFTKAAEDYAKALKLVGLEASGAVAPKAEPAQPSPQKPVTSEVPPVAAPAQEGRPSIAEKPVKGKVPTQREVDVAGTEYSKAVGLYGENNLETQRRLIRYMELKKAREAGKAKAKPRRLSRFEGEKPAETPAKAEAKVQEQVATVAQESGPRSAKELKQTLIDEIQQRLMAVPSDLNSVPPEQRKVTIEIPGDGTFTVNNTIEALSELLDRAKKLKTDSVKPQSQLVPKRAIKSSTIVLQKQAEQTESYKKKAEALAQKLEAIKAVDPLTGNVSAFGLVNDLWNRAISIVQTTIRAGGSIADAVKAALDAIKGQFQGTWDEAGATAVLQTIAEQEQAKLELESEGGAFTEPDRVKTQVMGGKNWVLGRDELPDTPETLARAQTVLTQLNIPHQLVTIFDPRRPNQKIQVIQFTNDGIERNVAGRQLAGQLDAETQNNPVLSSGLINAIRLAYTSPEPAFRAGFESSFTDPILRTELMALAQSEASRKGAELGALAGTSADLTAVALNADYHLLRDRREKLGNKPGEGADSVEKLLRAMRKNFGVFFTDSVVDDILNTHPLFGEAFDALRTKYRAERLMPSLREFIRTILQTPFYRQQDIFDAFRQKLLDGVKGASPAEIVKVTDLFQKAFQARFKRAANEALAQARARLAPPERLVFEKRSLWQKIVEAVNAGEFNEPTWMQAIAKARGWTVPTAAELQKLRSLAEQEQRLRELTPGQQAQFGKNPEALAEALRKREVYTRLERSRIKREIEARWARIVQPINFSPKHWLETRRNFSAAGEELEAANMLFSPTLGPRQLVAVLSQWMTNTWSRPIGQAMLKMQDARSKGDKSALGTFWQEAGDSLASSLQAQIGAIKPALNNAWGAWRGRAEARNVDRLLSGVAAFERMALKAKEMKAKGNHIGSFLTMAVYQLQLSYRLLQAMDYLHGTPAEFAERVLQADRLLAERGKTRAQRAALTDYITGSPKLDWAAAMQTVKDLAEADGQSLSAQVLREKTSAMVEHLQAERVRSLGLPADEIEAQNDIYRNVIGWNEKETRGPGAVVAGVMKGTQSLAGWLGLPVPIGAFSNAIGTMLNRGLHFTPLMPLTNAPIPGLTKEPSPWHRTDADRMQRRVEMISGSTVGGLFVALVLAGIARVQLRPPKDKEEQELWKLQGHRSGTVEFQLSDGSFIPVSLNNSPLMFVSPYLAAAGALRDLMEVREKKQARFDAQAARTGQPAQQLQGISIGDMLGVAGEAAYGVLVGGGRTATGALGSVTQYGEFNAEKALAGQIAPAIPLLPFAQALSRIGGVELDNKLATFWDFLLPLPTSEARKVNFLGDPVNTPDTLQRVIQNMTGGTYPFPVQGDDSAPYRSVFASAYRPPSISPSKGYSVNGEYRPLSTSELERYTQLRGQYFKEELGRLGYSEDKGQVQDAYRAANRRALEQVGVSQRPKRTTRPRKGLPLRSPLRIRSTGLRSRGRRLSRY